VSPHLLRVRVQPRAPRSEIVGWRADGTLSVRVAAPPVEGRANAALAALLAGALDVRPSAVSVEHGAHGRDKLVRIAGLTPAQVRQRIGGPSS
jgi:uncharacterized protein